MIFESNCYTIEWNWIKIIYRFFQYTKKQNLISGLFIFTRTILFAKISLFCEVFN